MHPDALGLARQERFEHRGLVLKMLLPESSEALIDEDEFNVDERLPYWAELWPAARALTRTLLDRPRPVGRAIELGCGVGLPSLALRSLNVDVVASDYYEDALTFTLRNARYNGIEPPGTVILDWRAPPPGLGRFDLVLAADVVYEARNGEALIRALPALVSPSGMAIIADPGRVHLQPFLDGMVAIGWSVEELPSVFEPSPAGNGVEIRVRLFELRPASGELARSAAREP